MTSLRAGVNGPGTDGAASNNDLDLIAEMRVAALLSKAVASDAAALPARTRALHLATLVARRLWGSDDHIGSLTVGSAPISLRYR